MTQKRVVVDFDNTMGVKGCDIDDGLALLFLLGSPSPVRIEAVCTTYGNSDIRTVGAATARLLEALAAAGEDIPAYEGAPSADSADGDAARFLARTAAENPGEIHVLALGSLTNVRGAAEEDPSFFANLAGITLMGGITESLAINGIIMDELNLSCDPAATRAVLQASCPVSIATSHNCLPAQFSLDDFRQAFGEDSWVHRTCSYWFDDMMERYESQTFVCWDVVAAAALARPDLFERKPFNVALNDRLLSVGYLEAARTGVPQAQVCAPEIVDAERFRAEVLAAWKFMSDRLV